MLGNNLRALAAYAEALKVRNERDTPLECPSTIANKVNVLRNLPDDPERPGLGRESSLTTARDLYQEARRILLRIVGELTPCGDVAVVADSGNNRVQLCHLAPELIVKERMS